MIRSSLIALILAVLPNSANAGHILRYGVGAFRSADYGSSNVKLFSIGYVDEILGPIVYQYEGGYFGDSSGHGRDGGGFGNVGLGIQANPGYMVFRSMWGVGGITKPDAMLGGRFQFNHDMLIGVRGSNEAIFGINLKHISSAGLERPNIGRDFLLIHLELPF